MGSDFITEDMSEQLGVTDRKKKRKTKTKQNKMASSFPAFYVTRELSIKSGSQREIKLLMCIQIRKR